MKCKTETCTNFSHEREFVAENCMSCRTKDRVTMDKKYRTRSGLPVRILCVDQKDDRFPVIGLIQLTVGSDFISTWTETGCYLQTGNLSDRDLIEVTPFDDFVVDDLCVVWSTPARKYFRYFSHAKDDTAACFINGTSYTNDGTRLWPNCRKATPEEVATKIINQDFE